ncbi:MAG: sensor hybrid histidine kinase [Rhodoferax sp.]|nr:sensor hybrid histidine kinase [Rhodoferax sp.]
MWHIANSALQNPMHSTRVNIDLSFLSGGGEEHVLTGRGSTWHENQMFPITRHDWTYSFGPIDDDSAETGIGGVLIICNETTRQMALSKRLADSDERLNQALSAGRGIGTWDWDVLSDQVVADARFARLYGVAPERARTGAPIVDFFGAIHPDDLPGLQAKIGLAMQGPIGFSSEYRLIKPGGEACWVLAEGRGEYDDAGRLVRLSGVSFDITDQKKAEARLRESEAHYRSVLAALHEGIFVTDPAGRVISCNPAAERIIGTSVSKWQGGSAIAPGWQPVRDDGTPIAAQDLPVGRVLAGHGPQLDTEVKAIDREGQPRVFQVSAVPVAGDDGVLMAVATLFVDVTVRRRADEELQSYRRGLEALVLQRTADLETVNRALQDAARFNHALTDAIPGRVVYWTRDCICTFANQAFAEWFGTTPDQLIGRSAREVHGEAYLAMIWPDLQAAFRGEPQHLIRETRDFQARLATHQVHYIPDTAEDGGVRGICVVGYDVTELKAAQTELQNANDALARSRDEAQQATRAKSAFLANMSHEIRTPMNAIIGLTHLMARDTRDSLQRDRLGKVANAAQHLLVVINDILDLSKIEAGKLELEHAEFAFPAVVSRATELIALRAREKGLQLIIETDAVPVHLCGDATRLSQILINLLTNAVKFTTEGWIRVLGHVEARDQRRVKLRIEVQDTGLGVPLAQQADLFGAFTQADSSISRQHGGTGLGLTLSRQLAMAMGGEAGVTSAPGAGSTFWFSAWLELGHEAERQPEALPAGGLHALVIDDLPESLAAMGNMLRAMNLEVDLVASGPAALLRVQTAMAAGRPYDIVFMDWKMTPLDGIETALQMRELLGEGMPPTVLVTDHDGPSLSETARASLFDALLEKPISPSSMHKTLDDVLRTRRITQPVAVADLTDAEAVLRRDHAGQRILLAEDNEVNREIAEELLRSAGLVVEVAVNGARAVELGLSRRYDLVLMDVQMPMMDGLDATRALRASAGKSLPIIAMTANAFLEDRAMCLAAGMNDHVAKPVSPATMYATLLRWLPMHGETTDVARPAQTSDAADATTGTTAVATGAAEKNDAVLARLRAIDGLDVDTGLTMTGGRVATYTRVLGRFAETYRDGVPVWLDASGEDAEGVDRWRAACHSTKGALATIGANDLGAKVTALEQALSNTGSRAANVERAQALQRDFLRLVDQLSAQLR